MEQTPKSNTEGAITAEQINRFMNKLVEDCTKPDRVPHVHALFIRKDQALLLSPMLERDPDFMGIEGNPLLAFVDGSWHVAGD